MAVTNLTDEDVRDIMKLAKDEKVGERVSLCHIFIQRAPVTHFHSKSSSSETKGWRGIKVHIF